MSTTLGQRLLFAPGPRITVEPWEVPAPTAHQVLVKISRSQVSAGSEMNYLRHGPEGYGLKGPRDAAMSIGYMAVGRILALGDAVTGLKVGQRVVTAGNHSSHGLVDWSNPNAVLDPIPEGVSDDAAGFAFLGGVALHGVRRAALQIDESVAIFGLGMVGQLTLQLARLSGVYPLIAVDLSDARLAQAKLGGASHTINPAREDPVRRIREITQGAGVEAIFHCTQVASMLQMLMECGADRAKIILTGSAPGLAQIGLQTELSRREMTITGNYGRGLDQPHPYWPWTRKRNRMACLRLMAAGDLSVDALITHIVAPDKAQGMFETMLQGSDAWLGVVVKWGGADN